MTNHDLDFVFRLHQHPDLIRFIPSAAAPDLETAGQQLLRFMELRDHPHHGFPLIELSSGEPVGILMVKPIPPSGGGDPTETEIGWRQIAEHCGKGYITEAATAMLTALREAGLSEVVAVMGPDNHASQAVAERIGMRREGPTEAYYDQLTIAYRTSSTAGGEPKLVG